MRLDVLEASEDVLGAEDVQDVVLFQVHCEPTTSLGELDECLFDSLKLDSGVGLEASAPIRFLELHDDAVASMIVDLIELLLFNFAALESCLDNLGVDHWDDVVGHGDDKVLDMGHELGLVEVVGWEVHLDSIVLDEDFPQILGVLDVLGVIDDLAHHSDSGLAAEEVVSLLFVHRHVHRSHALLERPPLLVFLLSEASKLLIFAFVKSLGGLDGDRGYLHITDCCSSPASSLHVFL